MKYQFSLVADTFKQINNLIEGIKKNGMALIDFRTFLIFMTKINKTSK